MSAGTHRRSRRRSAHATPVRRHRVSSVAWACGLAALLGVAGACGGDDGADDATPTTPGPTFHVPTTPAPTSAPTTAPTTSGSDAPTTTGGAPTTSTTPPLPGPDPRVTLTHVIELDEPVDLAVRPGDDALHVVERGGRIVTVRDGVASAPLLDISDLVTSDGERGLLGLAYHPTEPLAYVNYTDRDGDTVVAEYALGVDGTFDPASARVLLTIDQPYANHNGGGIAFGPDGMLYIGTGDGGSQDDPERVALDLSSLLGKMLRIDPAPNGDAPFTVPADNPFSGDAGPIWSVGLRNPWRFTFDPPTGDLWIADVGQNAFEEIDVAWADQGTGRGVSFGWSAYEGPARFNEDQPADGHVAPLFSYDRAGGGCSISGGARYRGEAIPDLAGWYVFADYCNGQLWALEVLDRAPGRAVMLAGDLAQPVAVRPGPEGELYVLALGGQLWAITR